MTPEERRQEVARLLADDPTLSQWAIAKLLGVSQRTVSRDMAALGLVSANQFVANAPKAARLQPVSPQDSGGMSRGAPVTSISPEGIAALMSAYVTRGDKLVARLREEMSEQGLVPTSTEEAHLATAKDLADRIEKMQKLVARDGESRKLKDGRVVLHPALAEIRQCESVLTRVVANIQTMETPAKDVKKQKAANTRWRSTQLAAVERERRAADPWGS
ncbi:helix-turn-helix domain-containing protein [Mycobacterium avium]|uniref:helix-turn-helix domain-containing protein n=1 Tax=Mycobacterium avium TaxID=1764 RepID=UPI000CE2E829|nr:helix-turn-helix domain-containing protein [Mycobacterium avium]